MQVERLNSVAQIIPISGKPDRNACWMGTTRQKLAWLFPLAVCWLLSITAEAQGQSDAFPVPSRSADPFAFPYPPPLPGEPGVTLSRRYMLDGMPELEFHLRPEDELWLVSSREMSTECTGPSRMVYRRSNGDEWEEASLGRILDSFNTRYELQNVIFLHGDRTDEFWARRRGKQVYQATIGNRPELPPTRFIIWAWPSEPERENVIRPFKDFANSLDRCPIDGFWLGCFLSHLPPEADPLLVSYSLGTQVVLTALSDLLAAGSNRNYRLLSIAPVTRCDWASDENEVKLAASAIRSLHLVRNDRDVAIRAFAIYCRLTTSESTTPGIDKLVAALGPTRQIDVACEEGSEHNVSGYIGLASVIREFDLLFANGHSALVQNR